MSIKTEITRIKNNVESALAKAGEKGGTVPEFSDNFASAYGLSVPDGGKQRVKFSIGGNEIGVNVTNSSTMEDVVNTLNKILPNFKCTASYDAASGRIAVADTDGEPVGFTVSANDQQLQYNGGISALLAPAIESIPVGTDTSDATAAAGDILSGKTAYVKGAKVTGNITSKGASDLTASGASVTVPAGYYPSAVSKSVATAAQTAPSISINTTTGEITASATQAAGYVSAGTKTATKQLTTQAAKTVTPSTSKQTAVASGVYTTGAVEVAAMPTATQATPSISVDTAGKITASATQTAGYVSAGTKSATKQLTTQAAKTVTPGTTEQTAVAGGVYTTGAVKVAAVPAITQATPSISVSSAGLITASAAQEEGYVSAGTKSATKQLTTVSGQTITPGTSRKTAVASGRYTTGAVYVAGDANLKAENIKSGVSIFGVDGTYHPAFSLGELKTITGSLINGMLSIATANVNKCHMIYSPALNQKPYTIFLIETADGWYGSYIDPASSTSDVPYIAKLVTSINGANTVFAVDPGDLEGNDYPSIFLSGRLK